MAINEILIISMFASFILLLFTGFPIAYVLGGVGVLFGFVGYFSDIYLNTSTGLDYFTMGLVINRIWSLVNNWVLVALPMFIFMGLMLDRSKIAERLMKSIQQLFGSVHGGLAISVTLIGVILAASTGIIGASVVLLTVISLPQMLKQNYSKEISVGTICSAGTLGILIPPSIMLVIMGDQLGLSVGDLFMGALFPGVLLGVFYILFIVGYGLVFPDRLPKPDKEAFNLAVVINLIKIIIPPVLLIFVVLGSIFFGVATPTEASGLGALGAVVLGLFYRQVNWKVIRSVCYETLSTTGFVFGIFVGATCFALVLRQLGGDDFIRDNLTLLPFGQYGVFYTIILIVFLLGFFLDWIEITLIVLPLLAPVISSYQWDVPGYGQLSDPALIWFAVVVAVTLQTSFLTPPVGFALFYLKGSAPPEITIRHLYKGVIPFIIIQVIGLVIVINFPAIVTWLPSVVYEIKQ